MTQVAQHAIPPYFFLDKAKQKQTKDLAKFICNNLLNLKNIAENF